MIDYCYSKPNNIKIFKIYHLYLLLQKEFIDGLKVNKNMKVDFFIITIFLKKEFISNFYTRIIQIIHILSLPFFSDDFSLIRLEILR